MERLLSLDRDGWSQIPLHPNAREVFWSSTGDDANDGLSLATPKRTFGAAAALMRPGFGDHLCVVRGSIFIDETAQLPEMTGLSQEYPAVFMKAVGTGNLPIFLNGSSSAVLVQGNASATYWLQNVYIGSGFVAVSRTTDGINFNNTGDIKAVNIVAPVDNVTLEGFNLSNSRQCLVVQGAVAGAARSRNVVVRRTVILDTYTTDGAHPVGAYYDSIDGLMIEETVADRAGATVPNQVTAGQGATIFQHCHYIQENCTDVHMEGNTAARATSTAFSMRSLGGAVFRNNASLYSSIGIGLGGVGGNNEAFLAEGNLCYEHTDIDATDPGLHRGWGFEIYDVQSAGGTLRNNMAYSRDVQGQQAVAYQIKSNGVVVDGNLSWNWDGIAFQTELSVTSTTLRNNRFVQDSAYTDTIVRIATAAAAAGATGNVITQTDRAAPVLTDNFNQYSVAAWEIADSLSENSQRTSVENFTDRTIASYHSEVMGGANDVNAFLASLRGQSRDTWDNRLNAQHWIHYIANGHNLDAGVEYQPNNISLTADWVTPTGMRLGPEEFLSVDVQASAGEAEQGINRVEFYVNGGVAPYFVAYEEQARRPNFTTAVNPHTGKRFFPELEAWGFDFVADPNLAGDVTIAARVVTGAGNVLWLDPITVFNDGDGVNRRIRNVDIYVDPNQGNNANDGLTRATAKENITHALNELGADLSDAQIILMPGAHILNQGSFSLVQDNGTTGDHPIKIIVESGATLERPGSFSIDSGARTASQPGNLVQLNGKATNNMYAIMEFMGEKDEAQITGADIAVDLGVNARGRFAMFGGIAQHPEYAPGKLSVLYSQDKVGGWNVAFAGATDFTIEYWGFSVRGVQHGLTGCHKIVACTVESWTGVALQATSTGCPMTSFVKLLNQAYDFRVEGFANANIGGQGNITNQGGDRMRLTITGTSFMFKGGVTTTQEVNLATQAAALVNSPMWGVKFVNEDETTFFGPNQGAHLVVNVGTDGSGDPYIEWDDPSGVAGPLPASLVIKTWRAPTAQNDEPWHGAVHPDMYQVLNNLDGHFIHTLWAENCVDTPSFAVESQVTSCINLHLVNFHDGRQGVRFDLQTANCIYANCCFDRMVLTGSASFNSNAGNFLGNSFRNNVFAGVVQNLPASGTNVVDHNHFVSATPAGTNSGTGQWFKNPSVEGDDMEPLDALQGAGGNQYVSYVEDFGW